jgi:hypothetical protein
MMPDRTALRLPLATVGHSLTGQQAQHWIAKLNWLTSGLTGAGHR